MKIANLFKIGVCSLVVVSISVIGLVMVSTVSNQPVAYGTPLDDACGKASANPYCQEKDIVDTTKNPIAETFGKVSQLFAIAGGVIAVVVIIYGGFRFVVSGGNPEKAATARNTVFYGLIGLVVILLAQFLIVVVLNAVTK